MTNVIDLRQIRGPSADHLADLQGYLLQLEGQPYLFLRFTYADELCLHFGTPQEYQSPKLRRSVRGSYVLTLRGSAWRLHSMPASCIIHGGLFSSLAVPSQKKVEPKDVEQMTLIKPGSRVISADLLGFRLPWGLELVLSFSDGSTFFVTPTPPDTSGDDSLPAIADWELFTPHGRVLVVGPGYKWEYADAGSEVPAATNGGE